MGKYGTVLFALASVSAFGQAPFTIVRPADGSKVRETVKIQVPLNSVPNSGYVGVYANGKFVEAVVPDAKGKYYEYPLDTKKLELPDGPTKIELVLYVDFNDQPRIVDRSSVTVQIGNHANIQLPPDGLKLRYRFVPGYETVYNVENRVAQQTFADDQAKLGSRPADLPADSQKIRAVYDCVNADSSGDGLLRLQGMPPAGSKSIFFQGLGDPSGRWYNEEELGQAYMKVSSTGTEIFGAVPQSFPMEGVASGPSSNVNPWFLEPLPTLPSAKIKPGQDFASNFQLGFVDLNSIFKTESIVRRIPARGEFVDVEWEMGHPCAKLKKTLEITGSLLPPSLAQYSSVKVQEDLWFALDKNVLLKMVRTVTAESHQQAQSAVTAPGGFPGFGNGTLPPGAMPPGYPGQGGGLPPSGGGDSGGDAPRGPNDDQHGPTLGLNQRGGFGGKGFGGRPGMGGPGMGRPGGAFSGAPGGAGPVAAPVTVSPKTTRITKQEIFILSNS